ncbi:MAG: type III polyketide synthase [Planctomycetes bacterium]|nr:type III polyketide synthase [Planctomycetota bacterium]
MRIASVASALPDHVYEQGRITRHLAGIWDGDPAFARRLAAFHENVRVERRHLARPLEDYDRLRTFGERNDAWIAAATDLGERALRSALDRAGLAPRDVDALFFSTVTGAAIPSIDARLVNRMGLRADVKRLPFFGLGCVAGAAVLARASDYVRAFPGHAAAVLTVELCSLTFQRGDRSVANLIATGLFGDGAGSALVLGAAHPRAAGPRIRATRSVFYPDTEDVMGWRVSEEGFRIVLGAEVPSIAGERLPRDVDAFLAEQGLRRSDIGSWVCHPGGPKVLAAMREGLGLGEEALALSWDGLRRTGNLSSASLLLILEETMARALPAPGTLGLLAAMGPGFCAELLLVEW